MYHNNDDILSMPTSTRHKWEAANWGKKSGTFLWQLNHWASAFCSWEQLFTLLDSENLCSLNLLAFTPSLGPVTFDGRFVKHVPTSHRLLSWNSSVQNSISREWALNSDFNFTIITVPWDYCQKIELTLEFLGGNWASGRVFQLQSF